MNNTGEMFGWWDEFEVVAGKFGLSGGFYQGLWVHGRRLLRRRWWRICGGIGLVWKGTEKCVKMMNRYGEVEVEVTNWIGKVIGR